MKQVRAVPESETATLAGGAVWAFARACHYTLSGIEHDVDATYRFSGLASFGGYWVRSRRGIRERTRSGTEERGTR